MQQGATLGLPVFVDLNVLPEELRPLRYPPWYSLVLIAIVVFGLLLIPLHAVERAHGVESASLGAELDLIKRELTDIEVDFGRARDVRQQLDATEASIARLGEERQAILGDSQELSADLAVAVQALPQGSHLTSMTAGDGRFTVTASAGQPADALGYYRALAGSERFSQTRITSMAIASGQQGGSGVTFTIEVTQ
jgi:hypothetical protein